MVCSHAVLLCSFILWSFFNSLIESHWVREVFRCLSCFVLCFDWAAKSSEVNCSSFEVNRSCFFGVLRLIESHWKLLKLIRIVSLFVSALKLRREKRKVRFKAFFVLNVQSQNASRTSRYAQSKKPRPPKPPPTAPATAVRKLRNIFLNSGRNSRHHLAHYLSNPNEEHSDVSSRFPMFTQAFLKYRNSYIWKFICGIFKLDASILS